MKVRAVKLVVPFLLCSFPAFAQEDTGTEATPEEPAAAETGATQVEEETTPPDYSEVGAQPDSSEANRVGKTISAVVEAGLGVFPFPTSGLAVGYYLNENHLAELNYFSGSLGIDKVNMSVRYTGLRWKWFIGNSFYTNVGVGQRNISFEASLDASAIGGSDIKTTASTTSTGLDLGIGNRWQWSWFSLGCDWVGYFMPLSSSGDTVVDVPGAKKEDAENFQEVFDAYLGEAPSLQLLRFYIGASF